MAKLKTSKDYPPLYVRLTKEDKESVETLVEEILTIKLRSLDESEKLPKRNSIILKALLRGLKSYKRELEQKS